MKKDAEMNKKILRSFKLPRLCQNKSLVVYRVDAFLGYRKIKADL